MTKADALVGLRALHADLDRQSKNPYNHSTKERHVREIMAEMAARLDSALVALEPKVKRGK